MAGLEHRWLRLCHERPMQVASWGILWHPFRVPKTLVGTSSSWSCMVVPAANDFPTSCLGATGTQFHHAPAAVMLRIENGSCRFSLPDEACAKCARQGCLAIKWEVSPRCVPIRNSLFPHVSPIKSRCVTGVSPLENSRCPSPAPRLCEDGGRSEEANPCHLHPLWLG